MLDITVIIIIVVNFHLRNRTSVELAQLVLALPARALTTPERLRPDVGRVSRQLRQVSICFI